MNQVGELSQTQSRPHEFYWERKLQDQSRHRLSLWRGQVTHSYLSLTCTFESRVGLFGSSQSWNSRIQSNSSSLVCPFRHGLCWALETNTALALPELKNLEGKTCLWDTMWCCLSIALLALSTQRWVSEGEFCLGAWGRLQEVTCELPPRRVNRSTAGGGEGLHAHTWSREKWTLLVGAAVIWFPGKWMKVETLQIVFPSWSCHPSSSSVLSTSVVTLCLNVF